MARFAAAIPLLLLAARPLPAYELAASADGPITAATCAESGHDAGMPACARLLEPAPPAPAWTWTFDYRFRSLTNSHTSYEFGTPELPPDGWAPLSRLNFNIDSLWHGVQIGLKRPRWGLHVEYLLPLQRSVQGSLDDYDWDPPGAGFTDLGIARQRWTDGHMLDAGAEFLLLDRPWGLPLEIWPLAGFRWQRFHLMCYDLVQYKEGGVWPVDPFRDAGNVLAFNQQYYAGYFGGQLRTSLALGRLPALRLTLQGDWACTEGYNVDHHLIREGDRYTIEKTYGGAWHAGLTAEMPLRTRLSLGCQIDYLAISTTGSHRLLNAPFDVDQSWTHGVRAWSDQTWLTAFVRVNW